MLESWSNTCAMPPPTSRLYKTCLKNLPLYSSRLESHIPLTPYFLELTMPTWHATWRPINFLYLYARHVSIQQDIRDLYHHEYSNTMHGANGRPNALTYLAKSLHPQLTLYRKFGQPSKDYPHITAIMGLCQWHFQSCHEETFSFYCNLRFYFYPL